MSKDDDFADSTAVQEQGSALARTTPGRLSLVVMAGGAYTTYPLPDSGDVVIGRAERANVRIDDSSISRRHAVIHIGLIFQVEDLGSANGTFVRDQRLVPGERVEISAGEPISLGTAMLILQARGAQATPRRIWSHGYFEARLEDEVARAERAGQTLALLRIRGGADLRADTVQETLAELLRASDVMGTYGPREYEVLLLDTRPDEAEAVMSRLETRFAERKAQVRIGLACYPRDARDPYSIFERASTAARSAQPDPAGILSTGEGRPVVVLDGAMKQIHRLVERVANSPISVLILGETGVGKEVIAETVHNLSPRAGKPFLRLNCAALSETLLESELFGHERGAFTNAVAAKPGLLETADGGTVFLDEVGELPHTTQVKLLRVLEDRKVTRVGGLKPKSIDVRFVAATNRDLEAQVDAGAFRRDLFFRLNGFSIVIPPLRQRVSEIEGLARIFIKQACVSMDRSPEPVLASEALMLLKGYSWPGNIRELKNVIERAVLLCSGGRITAAELPTEKMQVTFATRSRTGIPAMTGHTAPSPSKYGPPPAAPPASTERSAEEWDRVEQDRTPVPPPGERTPVPSGQTPPPLFGTGARPGLPRGAGLPPAPTRGSAGQTLPPPLRTKSAEEGTLPGANPEGAPPPAFPPPMAPATPASVDDPAERARIADALDRFAGNQTRVAEHLGISRRVLIQKIDQYNLPRPRKRD